VLKHSRQTNSTKICKEYQSSHTEMLVKWTAWLGIDSARTGEWAEFPAFLECAMSLWAGRKFPRGVAVIKNQTEGTSSVHWMQVETWSSLCHGCGLVESEGKKCATGRRAPPSKFSYPLHASNLMKWCHIKSVVLSITVHCSTAHLLLLNLDGLTKSLMT